MTFLFFFTVMPATLSWRLLCVCSSPYPWVGTLSVCLGMKDANVSSQSCKLIYAGELLQEAFLSNSVPYLSSSSCTTENETCY